MLDICGKSDGQNDKKCDFEIIPTHSFYLYLFVYWYEISHISLNTGDIIIIFFF